MIFCPNCKHENPEGATSCEACYTALPATKACPTCGTSVQLDATFCGQCGQNLSPGAHSPIILPSPLAQQSVATIVTPPVNPAPESVNVGLPPTVLTVPVTSAPTSEPQIEVPIAAEVEPVESQSIGEISPVNLAGEIPTPPLNQISTPLPLPPLPPLGELTPDLPIPAPLLPDPIAASTSVPATTQLQQSARQLQHLQTNTILELPLHLEVIHIGKPNDLTPPDLDISGFPCAEVVSRVHANIRVEGENYYIEDVGSANGTYINHNILAKGNRHLLRFGDRIGLGKGDLVTFIFQSAMS